MFGYGGPEDVVDPDEPFQEGIAMELYHGTIPQGGDGQGKKEAPAQLHVEQGMAVPVAQQLAVEQPGFVIPVVSINTGRQPAPGNQHFPGSQSIVGFYRVGDQKLSVGGKEQQQAQQDQQKSGPVPVIEFQQRTAVIFPVFHLPSSLGSVVTSIRKNLKGRLNRMEAMIKKILWKPVLKYSVNRCQFMLYSI